MWLDLVRRIRVRKDVVRNIIVRNIIVSLMQASISGSHQTTAKLNGNGLEIVYYTRIVLYYWFGFEVP